MGKLKSTYVDALLKLADPATGRVHTTFLQSVAATGRLSSRDPNLQNIPVRGSWGADPSGLRAGARPGVPQRRLFPDGAAHPGPFLGGPHPPEGLPGPDRHPPADCGGGVRHPPGTGESGYAPPGQGGQLRHPLRHERLWPGQTAQGEHPHGQRIHPEVFLPNMPGSRPIWRRP